MPNPQDNNQQSNPPTDNQKPRNGLDNPGAAIGGYASPYSTQSAPTLEMSQPTPNGPAQPMPVAESNPSQPTPPPVVESPNLQDFLTGTNTSTTTSTPPMQPTSSAPTSTSSQSDNLLDNQDQVNQILEHGDTLIPPTTQQPSEPSTAPAPTIAASQVVQPVTPVEAPPMAKNDNPQPADLPTPIPTNVTEEKPVVEPKETVELPKVEEKKEEPKLEPELPTVSAVQKNNDQPKSNEPKPQLNPQEDLKNFQPKDAAGNSMSKKYTKITELLDIVVNKKASDLHLTVGYPPFIRIDDKLIPLGATLTKDEVKNLVSQSLNQNQKELLEVNREVDLSYQHQDKGRFRINAYFERGNLAAAYRLIPQRIRSITELSMPGILLDFTRLSQGLFLVTGPTGSGKSTTLAAMIESINESTPKHILTIEDPIEYVYPKSTALVDQRELGNDTHDWTIAMKSALRQDPDVILIGELRDFETIQLAITLAETGHLVFATLHTNSAAQSIDRMIDVFPPYQQQQIKTQLAGVLKGIMSQRLVPLIGGGRQGVVELLIVTPAVQNLIREGKTYQIDNVIATSADIGMMSLEKSLVKLVRQGKITTGTAQDYAIRPEEILKLMKTNQL